MHLDKLCGELALVHSSSSIGRVQTFITGEIHEEDSSICDATEEPRLDLQVQEERHDLEMVDCIHTGKYGGYESLLVEGPLMVPILVVDVLMGYIH